MSAQGRSTRSRIVEAARSLFWYDGCNTTTVDKILARAKANPGSFYRFFNSKESVLLTVLSNSARNFVPGIVTPVMQNVADPIERVFEILNFYRGNLTKSKFRCGCLLGKLASEISEEQPHIHERIAIGFDTWTTAVAKCLEDAGQRFPAETDLKALSTFILAVMEGAVAQARAHQSIAPFDTAIQRLRTHFVLLQAVRRWEEQSELHQLQNAKRRARVQNKKSRPHRRKKHRRTPLCLIRVVLFDVLGKYCRRELSVANSAARRESIHWSIAVHHPAAKYPRPRPRAARLS